MPEPIDVEADQQGPSAWTQKPRKYFDIPKIYAKFLRPEKSLPSIVGSDIRRFQRANALRVQPWHGRHLENVTVKV